VTRLWTAPLVLLLGRTPKMFLKYLIACIAQREGQKLAASMGLTHVKMYPRLESSRIGLMGLFPSSFIITVRRHFNWGWFFSCCKNSVVLIQCCSVSYIRYVFKVNMLGSPTMGNAGHGRQPIYT